MLLSLTKDRRMLYSEQGTWLQKDSADPLEGWQLTDLDKYWPSCLLRTRTNDMYGRLYHSLGGLVATVRSLVHSRPHDLEIYAQDVRQLSAVLGDAMFDRIDVSNIVDRPYLGLSESLKLTRPLLNSQNSKATLLALFMNAIAQTTSEAQKTEAFQMVSRTPFRSIPLSSPGGIRASTMLWDLACDCVLPYEELFKTFMEHEHFDTLSKEFRLKLKQKHTIIESWPYAIPLDRHGRASEAELCSRMASGLTGWERYTEWILA